MDCPDHLGRPPSRPTHPESAAALHRREAPPEPWVVDDIRSEHEYYLARNGGQRAQTTDSKHHGIKTFRVERWRERWDLLGLAESKDDDVS